MKSVCLAGDISGRAIATSLINGVSVRRGLYIHVSNARSPAWGDAIEEEFGFKPTVSIFLRLDKTERLDAQVADMLFIATKLLAVTSDDLIVYFVESGDVWAIRRAGSLETNSALFM
ncbi:SitI3 family protein [Nocardia sp. NPDC087230]|uniref:SitI3 family protein n=1 Tax=Nocardia sp. NPDC087230 TaxID=3364331 RepID=UPI003817B4A7